MPNWRILTISGCRISGCFSHCPLQGKAYTFQGTIAAKMQRYKQIEKLDEEAEQEESELVSLGFRV
jgi:hypothetical protein